MRVINQISCFILISMTSDRCFILDPKITMFCDYFVVFLASTSMLNGLLCSV